MSALNTLRHTVNLNYGGPRKPGAVEYNAFPPRSRPGAW
eukprot:gene5408-43931_t